MMEKLDQVTSIQSDSGSIFYGCSFDTRGGDINISDTSDRSQLEINGINPKQEHTRREILRWLSGAQYKARHKRVVSEFLEGTGEWVFERLEFCEWLSAKGSSALWLHGIRKKALLVHEQHCP
ncbi:hypothetical protein N7450_009494 [Penicillium hetheringtonii]|uniref:Uncharacterized protein n=1 Tax=Penicillium hetheringtonii TaxID=911720 RepID=A0AAD6GP73_9EURO|nr:hypothetical protein N7450_009494 [Penicillium hetheringtonii]